MYVIDIDLRLSMSIYVSDVYLPERRPSGISITNSLCPHLNGLPEEAFIYYLKEKDGKWAAVFSGKLVFFSPSFFSFKILSLQCI
jgi:hypothetical protein